MKLYFVRHGESIANTQHIISNRDLPHPLTERGVQQAFALAQKLQSIPVAKIFSSPILRATQTAEILSQTWGVPYETTEALREFCCGILEGESSEIHRDDYARLFLDWRAGKWNSRFEGGESLLDVQARFVPLIAQITRDYRECDNIVLVSHGGTLLSVLPIVLRNIDHAFTFTQPLGNSAIVIAESTPDGLICRSWCDRTL